MASARPWHWPPGWNPFTDGSPFAHGWRVCVVCHVWVRGRGRCPECRQKIREKPKHPRRR